MLFRDLRALLADPPPRLPPAPRALQPVLVAGDAGRPPQIARFPAVAQRDAAVLALFHPAADGTAMVVLTERSAGGHRHAGQVSFPGGAIDDGESVVEAALREATEEVGLRVGEAGVDVVGTLAPIEVRVSGFRVHTVLAVAARRPLLVPDAHEVAAIIHAPLDAFLPGAAIATETADRDGIRLRYGFYPVGEYHVWGATARILGGLGAWLGQSIS